MGGTMGTDAALDICRVLPLGVLKYVVSTVSFSPLIEPQRLSADIQMILWTGGLYGLNSVCKSSLSQAAGAGPRSRSATPPVWAAWPLRASREMAQRLKQSDAPVYVLLPNQGIEEWAAAAAKHIMRKPLRPFAMRCGRR
ncbi:Tm-1-like ATP-binding domain-containing protein [Tateyamaria omphalii]|uniref:UPF0261 domain-containing protein n=1 Tax=Tateyamaria omphalii TaxID=299262 RepID=A0A1P8MRH9_9RHOB|nr:hypothetical protein BWR18_01930 [Tateyamaria omphalii]